MKKLLTTLGFTSILLLAACGDDEAQTDTPTNEEANLADNLKDNQPGVEAVEQDISTTYTDMEEVAGARVGDRDGVIEARIMFTAAPSEKEAIEIAEQFFADLQAEYANQTVTVTAVQQGKTITSLESK